MVFEEKEGYILFVSSGERNDLSSLIDGAREINKASEKYGVSFVLADYRKVDLNVPIGDAFNIVRHYEKSLPSSINITIAAVVDLKYSHLSEFWESICNQRGYNNRSFTDMDEAENWLLQEIESQNNKHIPK